MTRPAPRLFQAALYRCLDLAPSRIHGHGVFARSLIAKAEFIGRYEGPEVRTDDTYVLWIEDETGCRGVEGRNLLKFLNHSATPNAEFDGSRLYALRDIAAGEELTFDYGEDWADSPAPESSGLMLGEPL